MMWDSKDGPNPLITLSEKISIDGPSKEHAMQEAQEAPQTAKVGVVPGREHLAPGEIPDAPEEVKAGVIPEPAPAEEDEQQGGLSGRGSYEAAMRMFGPPMMPPPEVGKRVT